MLYKSASKEYLIEGPDGKIKCQIHNADGINKPTVVINYSDGRTELQFPNADGKTNPKTVIEYPDGRTECQFPNAEIVKKTESKMEYLDESLVKTGKHLQDLLSKRATCNEQENSR